MVWRGPTSPPSSPHPRYKIHSTVHDTLSSLIITNLILLIRQKTATATVSPATAHACRHRREDARGGGGYDGIDGSSCNLCMYYARCFVHYSLMFSPFNCVHI